MSDLERLLSESVPDVGDQAAAAAERLQTEASDAGLLDVAYAELDSPVGPLIAASTKRGLVRISFSGVPLDDVLDDLAERISPRVLEAPARLDPVRRELDEYFDGKRTEFDVPLDWSLTRGFRRKVLEHTARIPFGEVSTYTEMALAAGSPRAVRAAGSALGSNPLPVIVPCHRVLRTGGGLGGYGGGLEMKSFLLGIEGFDTPGMGPARGAAVRR
ncbi:MAG: methylated-DNA--[protein]-cysteine S-methyltransferase [Thermoleophilaceae bacterium]|nr:methylated-DNA--[protein]-cysteine S-methyltransferase [Thermoleophilaceae bacterium]